MPLASIAFWADSMLIAAGPRAGRKEPPLADARHQLEPAFGQPQPLVERRQTPLQLGGRDHLVRQRVPKRFKTNATKVHGSKGEGGVGKGEGERASARGETVSKTNDRRRRWRITEHIPPRPHGKPPIATDRIHAVV